MERARGQYHTIPTFELPDPFLDPSTTNSTERSSTPTKETIDDNETLTQRILNYRLDPYLDPQHLTRSLRNLTFLTSKKLLPSFLHPTKTSSTKPLQETAWLDGLRGVASLFVVFHHSVWMWYSKLHRGYGSDPNATLFLQLPIVRLLYTGPGMVAVFFVISGFSLSYKPLRLAREARYAEVLDSLASSVFRRGIRLCLPPAFSTFCAMMTVYLGWHATGPGSFDPAHFLTFAGNFKYWLLASVTLADPFRPLSWPQWQPPYDPNLWTIPLEFQGSLVVFLTVLGLVRVRASARLIILVLINGYLLYAAHAHTFLFVGGVLLAELHHVRCSRRNANSITLANAERPSSSMTRRNSNRAIGWNVFWSMCFVLVLFVLSMPQVAHGSGTSPGYITLTELIPQNYHRDSFHVDFWWPHIAAFGVVFVIDNCTMLQSIFTTRLIQYLGRISFALYICHATFLYSLGWFLSRWMVTFIGQGFGDWGYEVGILLTGLVLYPSLFWAADLVSSGVDQSSVRLAGLLWIKCKRK